jgi:phage terminase large subunit
MFYATTATNKIKSLTKRIRAAQGGTSASKTISILLYLIALAQSDPIPTLTSIISESLPHLKRGAIRDFKKILQTQGYWVRDRWNASDYVYTFETGSQIEFFSADNGEKLHGGRRDRLFINEANHVAFNAFDQAEVRTNEFIFLDWNPSNEFWFYTEVLNRTDVDHIILTFRDNEALPQSIVDSILQRQNRKGWWKVYGEGLLGEVEGKIYKGWKIIDSVPHEARLERIGLDFGYSNDPSAIVAVYKYDGGYILDEITFLKGLSNKQISDILLNEETKALVIADSAEPKSIDEIRLYGVNITGASKGKDSVNNGIQLVQDQKISVTKRSVNVIKEYRNYLWETDKEGKILNVPEHTYSHSMDAIRYALVSILNTKPKSTDEEETRAINAFLKQVPGIKQVEIGTPAKDYDEKRAVLEFLGKR